MAQLKPSGNVTCGAHLWVAAVGKLLVWRSQAGESSAVVVRVFVRIVHHSSAAVGWIPTSVRSLRTMART